jgi:ferritin-like protein
MKSFKTITEAYADRYIDKQVLSKIIDLLKNALKEELNAWYGYLIVKEFLSGTDRSDIMKMYEDTAKDELEDHGYWLIKRINELGGTLDDLSLSPASWVNATHPYAAPKWKGDIVPIKESLETNIQNELGAIESYKEIIELTKDVDYTTCDKCKHILADEEEHLQLLQEFLDDIKN